MEKIGRKSDVISGIILEVRINWMKLEFIEMREELSLFSEGHIYLLFLIGADISPSLP